MDTFELKKEQLKLASKVTLNDSIRNISTIGGAYCLPVKDKLLGCVVVLDYPSLKLIEKKTFLLDNPLPYRSGYEAYREMPAIIEAYNNLEIEPDVLLVNGQGIIHPRKFGIASHLGLAISMPTIGVSGKLPLGEMKKGKIIVDAEVRGFEMKTKEYANPVYVSPGHLVSLGLVLNLIPQTIKHPHKLPEPLHIAHKIAKNKVKKIICGE